MNPTFIWDLPESYQRYDLVQKTKKMTQTPSRPLLDWSKNTQSLRSYIPKG